MCTLYRLTSSLASSTLYLLVPIIVTFLKLSLCVYPSLSINIFTPYLFDKSLILFPPLPIIREIKFLSTRTSLTISPYLGFSFSGIWCKNWFFCSASNYYLLWFRNTSTTVRAYLSLLWGPNMTNLFLSGIIKSML